MRAGRSAARNIVKRASFPDLESLEANVDIGNQIRNLRKARRLSLQQMAEKLECSIGYLSQVERNQSRLTIDSLVKISRALGVPMHWFFQQARTPAHERDLIVRAKQRRRMDFPKLGIREELLSPTLDGPLELLMSTFEPGAASGEEAYTHHGFEAGVILEGQLELWVDKQSFLLNPGDSFSFESRRKHRFKNPGTKPTRVIWVITPPTY